MSSKGLKNLHIGVGDLGWAFNPVTGKSTALLFGDTNKSQHVGECSKYVSDTLHSRGRTVFFMFPGSKGRSALTTSDSMALGVRSYFSALSGADNLWDLVNFMESGADPKKYALRKGHEPPFEVDYRASKGLNALRSVGLDVPFKPPMGDFPPRVSASAPRGFRT